MNKFLPWIWLFLMSTGLAETTNAITGAFGVKFGEPFQESRATTTFSHPSENAYEFIPTNRVPQFTTYEARTPGHTNIVIEIFAAGPPVKPDDGRVILQETERILRLKYGEPHDSDRRSDFIRVTWERDSRTIDLALLKSSEEAGMMRLMVKYRDEGLVSKLKPKKKEEDTSGL